MKELSNQFFSRISIWKFACLAMIALSCLPAVSYSECSESKSCELAPGLFVSRANLVEVKRRIAEGEEPYASFYSTFIGTARASLNSVPNPFFMSNPNDITFGWCGSAGGEDDSFKDLIAKLTDDSNRSRNLAIAYLLTGEQQYADKARQIMLAWAQKSTLINFYDFNIDFKNATFDGIEEGYCNKSWNMALDSMWQAYGLINFSDVYAILTRNDYKMADADRILLDSWLRTALLPATNAGCHAWTRWADAHPGSSAYERYRSDNHLSWCLAGWAAAAAALNDDSLWSYTFNGGQFDDGISGVYANPSNFEAQVDYAISPNGVVYDQAVRESSHKGLFYAHFSLWSLSLAAQIAEVHKGINYWTFTGSEGGSLVKAFDYYARYGSGDLPPPDPEETTDPAFFRFLYEMVVGNNWVTNDRRELYLRARDRQPRTQILSQAIGPVSLLTGDLGMVNLSRPNPPTDVEAKQLQ